MWYVYILQSKRDKTCYVGITNDLRRRLLQHNNGKVQGTRWRIPYVLIYYEAHNNQHDAATREKFLKTGWGKSWIQRTLNNYFRSKKLGG